MKDTNVLFFCCFFIGATRLDNIDKRGCGISNQDRKRSTTRVVLAFGLESVLRKLDKKDRRPGCTQNGEKFNSKFFDKDD